MNPLHVILYGSSPDPRLSKAEIDLVFEFAFRIHNHDASTPAQPIFWLRTNGTDLWQFAN